MQKLAAGLLKLQDRLSVKCHMKMRQIGYSTMSVTSCHPATCNIPEEKGPFIAVLDKN
jgi:hypothetical protein